MISVIKRTFLGAAVAMAIGVGLPALTHASVVYTDPSGVTALALPTVNYTGTGPETIAAGVTWSSNDAGSKFGGQFGTAFSTGWWDLYGTTVIPNYMVDTSTGSTMTIAMATPVAFFGALVDWATNQSGTISAYDASNTLLDSIALNTLTPATCSATQPGGPTNNCGNTVGFLESSDNISKIVISNGIVGATDLAVATSAQLAASVPEPGSKALFVPALAVVALTGIVMRRRRAQPLA